MIASLILVSAPLAGCLDEELIDDILGCMDENAANYDDNATSELVGDCIYMASMETFIEAMTDMGSIEDMLEESPKAGYSQSISSSEWNQDMGMQMDIEIEDIVMVDLDNDAVYVHNSISIVGLLQMGYTHVQVGEIVNIHALSGGMLVEDGAGSVSFQTRDATPNVLEVIAEQSGLFTGEDGDDGDDGGDGDDEFPEDAEITITMSDDMDSQTMTMAYTEDGAEITMTIHIDQNEDLMSFSMESDNGSATSSMTYEMMWGDSIVIEVDETLPKTSNPIWFEEGQDEDDDWDDGEDTFHCDNGNEVPMDHVDDGWDDCGDGSDEFDDDGDDGDGPPTPEEAMESVDANGDGYMSYQEFQDAWDSDPENPELDYDEVTILFDDCDYDDSDLIDIDEMQCFIDGIVDTLPDEGDEGDDGDDGDPEQMFGHIDTDGDGYVSIQDIIDFSNEGGDDSDDEVDEEELSDWFSWCDTDGDDLLNLDEFTTCVEDDDGDDGDDDGNDIYWQSYYGGYCEWEGDSDGDDTRWWCKESQDDEYWNEWWYYCEHHDSDWHCTDDLGQSEEFEHSADNDEWSGSEDGEDGHDDDLPPSPEDAMNMTDADGDGYMSQDEFVTYWNNENSDAPIDSDQSFLTTEDVEDLIELCDYDAPSDLIDINEMQCFIDNLVGMMPDDENTPSLDDFFNHFDTDGDGHLTATEFIDANDVPDEDQDGVHDMFDMYDNDESGGLDYYEFEPLYDMMVDNDDGDHHETEEDAGHHHHGDGDYHHDHVDGSDGHTHDDADRHHDHDDDDSDDDSDSMERNDATGFVAENQTLNAPITDFEVHFLSDCEEEYDEEEDQMIQPDLSTCTNEFSIPLIGGEMEGVTITYTDHDGDGLVSPGDEMSVEWGDYDGEEIDKMEIYDTWASQYSSESAAMPPVLPGFGAILGALALLGAAIASRRD